MTQIPWYEPLTGEELANKHVHVTFTHGSMDGRLNSQGAIDYWAEGHSVKYVQILKRDDIGDWYAVEGVRSVALVWDEREWEQIDVGAVKKHDAIVVNGRLLHITGVGPTMLFVKEPETAIPPSIVSQALRYTPLPRKQGFYESESEDVFYLTGDNEWWMIDDDDVAHLSLPPTVFLPLTPIHFEKGETDHE